MGRILRPQDIVLVDNMYDAGASKMGRLRKILSGLSDLDSVVSIAPVNVLPTRGFRQKTIPDRREFDKLMESGSRG